MLLTMFLQVNAYAADSSGGLEDAVKAVKAKITVPSGLTEFSYRSGTEGERKVWSMDWSNKDGDERVSASVDEKGNILRYSHDTQSSVPYKKKLPKISRQDARIKAEDFIGKMNPELPAQVKYVENDRQIAAESTYSLYFARVVDGVQFPENYISIMVNSETGEVQNYNLNWTDGLTFPAKEKAISPDKAENAFKEKLGFRLSYSYKNKDKKIETFAVYSSVYQNSYIDALTGEKITLDFNINPMYDYAAGVPSYEAGYAKNQLAGAPVSLTPEEIKAIEEVSKLISKEDMEKKLRGIKALGLSDDFTVTSVSLDRDWADAESLIWQFSFTKNSKDSNGEIASVGVNADAKTGELKDFWISVPGAKDSDTAKYDKQASKAAVEEFLKEIQPDKFKATEYDEDFGQPRVLDLSNEKLPLEYNFGYIRKVNGAVFPSNYISVRYDAVNGRITSYNMSWFNVPFGPVDKVVPLDKIYDSLFKDIGLELQYKSEYPDEYYIKASGMPSDKKPEVKLVYVLNPQKPAIFDANTGDIITSDGEPFKEVKPPEYKDIKGHFAEKQIKVLAEYGITFEEGDEFNPDGNILQKDFAKLLCSLLNYYFEPKAASSGDNSQIDEMYKTLIREGVIKASEKAPDSAVAREDSVKFLIRTLKYDKVADLKGIFNCGFKDKDKIDPALVGYVVIADGLNIIKGSNGYFNPKKTLTRAEAVIEAYNYLQD